MQPKHCNYYGTLEVKVPKYKLGEFILDEAYTRILDKHENILISKQDKIICKLKNTFSDELKTLKELKSSIIALSYRIKAVEKSLQPKKIKPTRESKDD